METSAIAESHKDLLKGEIEAEGTLLENIESLARADVALLRKALVLSHQIGVFDPDALRLASRTAGKENDSSILSTRCRHLVNY